MRKYCTALVLFGIAVMVLGVISPAAVVAQDTDNPSVTQGVADTSILSQGLPKPTCPILALDLDTLQDNEALDVLGIGYTLVSPAAFSTINLDDFHVLYVGWDDHADPAAFTALNARKSDIASWVQKGNSIVALAENAQGYYTWIPLAVTITLEHNEPVTITAPSHAIMTGLTNALLSDWDNSYHNYFNTWDPSFTVLTETTLHDLPITLAATYGTGNIIITGQDADWHTVWDSGPGAMLLLNNMLSYACGELRPVGGYAVPVNKIELVAPWIALASVVSLAGAVAVALKKGKR